MSYCRFSSMNFMCDVYVYEDVYGGWTTHVAGNRCIIPPIPRIPWSWLPKMGRYDHATRSVVYPNRFIAALAWVWLRVIMASDRLQSWSLRMIPRRAIGLPFDGGCFNDATAGACATRLIALRRLGYKVPDYAITALVEESSQ